MRIDNKVDGIYLLHQEKPEEASYISLHSTITFGGLLCNKRLGHISSNQLLHMKMVHRDEMSACQIQNCIVCP